VEQREKALCFAATQEVHASTCEVHAVPGKCIILLYFLYEFEKKKKTPVFHQTQLETFLEIQEFLFINSHSELDGLEGLQALGASMRILSSTFFLKVCFISFFFNFYLVTISN